MSAKVYAALLKAKQEFGSVKVNADNPFFKSKYLDLGGVMDATEPALHKNGLVVIQTTDITDMGTPVLVTTLAHESGESIAGRYPLRAKDLDDPQKLGAAVTYSRRYALMALLGIAPEDDDGNTASGRSGPSASVGPTEGRKSTSSTSAPSSPTREPQDEPCSVFDCPEVCSAAFVEWSKKNFGRVLCRIHSAEEKKRRVEGDKENITTATARQFDQIVEGGDADYDSLLSSRDGKEGMV